MHLESEQLSKISSEITIGNTSGVLIQEGYNQPMGSKETSGLRAQTINPQNTTKAARPFPVADTSLECARLLPPQPFPCRQMKVPPKIPQHFPS